jgi:choline dehydrogenase-like flavoprotein
MSHVTPDFDVIIVGSGPAGVSAAFPLIEAGLKVLMVDGGREAKTPPPATPYLTARLNHSDQADWMLGRDFHALNFAAASSPKFRTPTHSHVFEGFEKSNRIVGDGFVATGSLARGGLSNAWGCGVAKLSAAELKDFPFSPDELEPSYARVTRRMGVSGASQDDLAAYFGLDAYADAPIAMDSVQANLLAKYQKKSSQLHSHGVKLGRSRVAALSTDRGERKACNLSGNCLWGCDRKALYSAFDDLTTLQTFSNFFYRPGFVVEHVFLNDGLPSIQGHGLSGLPADRATVGARKVVLAAGTLASSRLAMLALKIDRPLQMQSTPVAAFMLWLPAALGTPRTASFGLGQLSFSVSINSHVSGFGSLFNTTGIPISEFAKYMAIRKPLGLRVLKSLLTSCVVGNVYLPGSYTKATLQLDKNQTMCVSGNYLAEVPELMQEAKSRLMRSFLKLGALMLPGSFTLSKPGGDVHHACSLPMRTNPVLGQTNRNGELFGLPSIYVADGASLSSLSEKSHTLTIMANADRIGRTIKTNLLSL